MTKQDDVSLNMGNMSAISHMHLSHSHIKHEPSSAGPHAGGIGDTTADFIGGKLPLGGSTDGVEVDEVVVGLGDVGDIGDIGDGLDGEDENLGTTLEDFGANISPVNVGYGDIGASPPLDGMGNVVGEGDTTINDNADVFLTGLTASQDIDKAAGDPGIDDLSMQLGASLVGLDGIGVGINAGTGPGDTSCVSMTSNTSSLNDPL